MPANDLEVLLRSRVPIIVVDSRDEARVLKSLARACALLAAPAPAATTSPTTLARSGMPLFGWTVTDGLRRVDIEVGPALRTLAEPIDILKHIRATNLAGAYALLDFHPYLREPTIVRLLKDIA